MKSHLCTGVFLYLETLCLIFGSSGTASMPHPHMILRFRLASCSFDDIVDAAAPDQTLFLQLYVNRDREITKH